MSRRPVAEPDWGWANYVRTVETETITRRGGRSNYAVQAVYVNDVHIGFVVGRPDKFGGRNWWATVPGVTVVAPTTFPSLLFGVDDRRMAIENLMSTAHYGGTL